MKTSLKKLVSSASIVALVVMNVTLNNVNAAPLNDAVWAVTWTTWITVTSSNAFASTTDCTATITKIATNWVSTPVTVSSCSKTDASTLTISATTEANVYYTVAFTTDNWIYWTVSVGDTTNNVQVKAQVLPILTMGIVWQTIDFGTLEANVLKTSSTTTALTINTNAALGYILKVQNSWLKDWTKEIPAATASEDLAWGSNYWYGIQASAAAWQTIDSVNSASVSVAPNYAWTWNVVSWLSTTATTLATSAWPVANQVTTVTYKAKVSPLQPTWNYTDTVTYTVTWSF